MTARLPTLLAGVAIGLLVAALAAGGAWLWLERQGQPRPSLSLPDLDGEPRQIAEWDGKILVVNFWATWCAPCREEIPLFTDLQRRFGDDGVQFLGIAIDRVEAVRAFAKEYDLNYPTLHGVQSAMEAAAAFGNEAGTLPYTVVVDGDGMIRHVFPRQVHEGDLAPILAEMTNAR